ncbi:MAG: winged helix-turn-helix domain-containing protein [Candidatus Nanoarchaeia archaeon]|nr:winged helix-turn-helix domain-containing protein [Candidatus Nanoarchaeia archaeon]
MGFLDIIYNMVNKSGKKKKQKQGKPLKKKAKKQATISNPESNTSTVQKLEQKIIVKDLSDTQALLNAWNESVKSISDHPLSQAKIINNQILEQLSDILSSMDKKLDKLSFLDEILHLLKGSRAQIMDLGGNPEDLDKAITHLEGITIKDEEVIRALGSKGPQTAESLARLMGISRSTASSRLNRLFSMNLIRKKTDGKFIYFSVEQKN